MPFDGLPENLVSDLVKLRIACDGIRRAWTVHELGAPDDESHCALGWLLVATDWDEVESTRLALDYLYPALPKSAQHAERLVSVYRFNDSVRTGHKRIVRLFEDAIKLAEAA